MASPNPLSACPPHPVTDLSGVLAGERVLIAGHAYYVQRCNLETHGRAQRSLYNPGATAIDEITSEIELRLIHADWDQCPAAHGQGAARA